MAEKRSLIQIKRNLQKLSKELEEKAFNNSSIRVTEYLYDASQYVDEALRKVSEAIERREIESKVYR